MTDDSDQTLTLVPWRTGRKVHRTIYAQIGAEPSDAHTTTNGHAATKGATNDRPRLRPRRRLRHPHPANSRHLAPPT